MHINQKFSKLESVTYTFDHSDLKVALMEYAAKHHKSTAEYHNTELDWYEKESMGSTLLRVELKVSFEEIDKFLVPPPAAEGLSTGDVVELTSGPFKGERARICLK